MKLNLNAVDWSPNQVAVTVILSSIGAGYLIAWGP